MSKYARKADRNHAEVREVLRGCGYRVKDTFRFPGMLDLLAMSKSGILVFFEVKMPGESVTEAERDFIAEFGGHVVYNPAQALEILSEMDEWRVTKC